MAIGNRLVTAPSRLVTCNSPPNNTCYLTVFLFLLAVNLRASSVEQNGAEIVPPSVDIFMHTSICVTTVYYVGNEGKSRSQNIFIS